MAKALFVVSHLAFGIIVALVLLGTLPHEALMLWLPWWVWLAAALVPLPFAFAGGFYKGRTAPNGKESGQGNA